jgi:uncharacterized protein (DUF1015 family)
VARGHAGHPLFDFTADDGVQHALWAASPDATPGTRRGVRRVPALYIADGHHRAASAARARAALPVRPAGAGEADTFIAVAFPDTQMQILPYNRS